jgi:6-phospho-beta-glucosidase
MSVLGGSSPFTVDLVDALAERPDLVSSLVLHGRDETALTAVARHARAKLTVPVAVTRDGREAIAAGDVILHQVRYGGADGRISDARLAQRFGLSADETLGVSGLVAALRLRDPVTRLGRLVSESRPDAWFINLTNPMSVSVSLLAAAGVRRVIGVCELPAATEAAARSIAAAPPAEWHYQGLNHRGLLYGMPWFDAFLAEAHRRGDFVGVKASVVEELGAIPMKYFRLVAGVGPGQQGYARPAQVAAVRERALAELIADPLTRPPSLVGRPMPWYADAVVPVLDAIRDGGQCVASLVDTGGLARETWVDFAGEPAAVPQPRPGITARHWLDRWDAHENAVLRAVDAPDPVTVRDALVHDPTVDRLDVDALVAMVLDSTGEMA